MSIRECDRVQFEQDLKDKFSFIVAEGYKEQVEKWIDHNYEPSVKATASCYTLKHFFQREIGYVTHGALTLWLDEWGFRVEPDRKNSEGTYNYKVWIKARRGARRYA